ncbi:Fic family protein [Lacihabitans sp. LS3-19]|uniref:Fic family protein n=1 Tax=Lacihabitans sp. LS3-19 TaxID=2487335 RepID=UPI0020CD0056|nr:Fic family protein [Lacihabitans sp. LS3-19]MCP9766694.1 Fic family protein [Lacihabitans sp. LS3-19]
MIKGKYASEVIGFLKENQGLSSKDIFDKINLPISYATLKRLLSQLAAEKLIEVNGVGKATTYSFSKSYQLFYPVDLEIYFGKEVDQRKIKDSFDFELMPETLSKVNLFTEAELEKLEKLQGQFLENIGKLSAFEYNKEMERLVIDLSWKSSQIEGNTYSLLETELLLKEKLTAKGKTKDDAVMLLNHKDAIDFILEHTDYLSPLSLSRIEDIHSILIKELGIERNIRIGKVGISGTNYMPIDNEFQIKDALYEMCKLINKKESIFEKSFLALVLLSYIQPFVDGNKRTARIVSNAILIANKYCPTSFRTVDSLEYKKAMLVFYEQNNVQPMKQIFIDQYEFAVKTYF